MITCRCLVVALLCASWVGVGRGQAPVFRADVNTVAVNVSVREGRMPVQGLVAADFRLYDEDIAQDVAAVSLDAIPVDVSIVVKTAGHAYRTLDTIRGAVRGMTALLRPADRFRVLTTRNAVVQSVPWQSGRTPDTSAILLQSGNAHLLSDAVVMALFHRTASDRRHLVVVLGDGEDSCSLVSGSSLQKAAERTGAVLHWINVQRPTTNGGRLLEAEADPTGKLVDPGVRAYCSNQVYGIFDLSPFLSEAVRVTGGTVQSAWFSADRVAVDAFDRIFDDFRRSYVLHYTPQRVSTTGWHRLRVEMVAKGYTVRARTGYWGAADAATPAR